MAGSFWNYYPDKPSAGYVYNPNNITAARIPRERILKSIHNSESFDYKVKFINPLPGINDDANNDVTTESEEIKIIVPLRNFTISFLV